MLALRGLQRIKTGLSQYGNQGLRSVITCSDVVQQKEDMLVKMKNPFLETPTGCPLCNVTVDFKNIQLLSQFVSPYTGRVYGRHITKLCSRKQKEISKEIKKAQSMGFMSVTHKHPQFMKDPNILSMKIIS
ncbi:small ribosomal subunit protein bS18m [Cottoperca gobio]|uniref:Small ribosomal subunit protein bS18m n=1 Tax=Cottoperca gobio TaxID=56716 RepID=A0A6J2PC40_COTGO|nr:28S ribosomal protein S18c, mitochondrial [Cottoperca gobio]